MKKHSSGALTSAAKRQQDEKYRQHQHEGDEYDFLFIGSGNAALTCATLLANRGYRICMLEAHDQPGGYAHTFRVGEYSFCAQVHYIWGCDKGGLIYEFLRRVGLEQDIEFTRFDPDGYDHMIMPDGRRVKMPYGWSALQRNIEQAYPETTGLDRFFKVVRALRDEMAALPRKIHWWDYIIKGPRFPTLIKYRNATVQNLFDECGVSVEARTILTAQAGDLLLPPERLSLLFYVGLLGGYGSGAYAPTRHFKYYIERLARFLADHDADIFFEERVTGFTVEGDGIAGVTTDSGKTFTAKHYVCGMDPQAAASMIGWDRFPSHQRKLLSYDYSDNGVMVYLGLKPGFEPQRYGLGNHNTWHCLDWDMNTMWEAGERMDIDHAWVFMSTPTTHGDNRDIAPPGGHILELGTYVPYAPFKKALDDGYGHYRELKEKIAERMIDIVERDHIPDLRKHIAIKVTGSPTTSEDFCLAPYGNAYGAAMSPEHTVSRLTAKTPFRNLSWCNASSGSPGIYGTAMTGMNLYMDLTGDHFFDQRNAVADEC